VARRASSSGPYPPAVDRLIEAFADLPGIGRRTAERLAFHVLKSPDAEAMNLAKAIEAMKTSVKHCSICFNLTETDPCPICADASRRRGVVLVVEQPRDLIAIEKTGMYDGVYHVLLGQIDPLEGVGPAELTVDALARRMEHASANCGGEALQEIVLGLSPTLEGDGTGLHIAELARSRGVRVARLARGLPTGSQLEYASKAVLADAIRGRQSMDQTME
jgi:recombination protein RecR